MALSLLDSYGFLHTPHDGGQVSQHSFIESTSNAGASLHCILTALCSIPGAQNSWIVCKNEFGCADVFATAAPSDVESFARIAELIVAKADQNGPAQAGIVALPEGMLFCSDLLMPGQESNIVFYLGILFDKKFRFSSFNKGLVEGFRYSISALIHSSQ